MRNFTTLFLLLLALGLGGLVVIQRLSGDLHSVFGSPALAKGDVVYRFDPSEVTDIHIMSQDGTKAIVKKKGGVWTIEEPWQDLADARLIKSILDFSNTLKIEDVIERDDVEDMADLGLKSARIEVKLLGSNGRTIADYRIGRNTAWRSVDSEDNNFPTVIIRPAEDDQEDYLYVCADQADPKLRTLGIRTLFDKSLKLFRDHRAFYNHPFFATEINLKDQSSEISLARPNLAKNSAWQITKPFDLAANSRAVQKLLGDLGNLQGIEVLDPSAITLPAPTAENIERTITAKFALPGGKSEQVSVFIYPPEQPDSPTVFARIGQSPEALRPAVIRLLRGPKAILTNLPKSVNQLRSRTMTSLSVAQLKDLEIKEADGRSLKLGLEWNPHERANRWHAAATKYVGPANEEQVKLVFETLFKNPIIRFADDAATDLSAYGLAKPMREAHLTLQNDKKVTYQIGQKWQDHFYVREKSGQFALPITAALYQALKKGQGAKELTPLFEKDKSRLLPVRQAKTYGFEGQKTTRVKFKNATKEIQLGKNEQPHFFATEKDSRRVVEVPAGFFYSLSVDDFRWRQTRLWNLSAFETRGIIIDRSGRQPLNLAYNFFRSDWQARIKGQNVTNQLNSNKADRLLEKLTDLRVNRWLGPKNSQAEKRLRTPNLTISILVEEVDSEGEVTGQKAHRLLVAQVNPGTKNEFFYGKSSSDPDYFLLDLPTVQRLAVDLLD